MSQVENAIQFGLENLYIAPITNGVHGTPKRFKGLVKIKLDAKGEVTPIYADNGIHHIISANNGYEGELMFYSYTDEFFVDYVGFKKDKNGILYEPKVLTPKPCALLFQVSGDKQGRCNALYNVVFEKPSDDFETNTDKIEAKPVSVKFKASTFDFDTGISTAKASTTDPTKKATWFTTVYKPTDK